ncbi:hypothetical protein L917_07289, partial [Phytophthora nicotianae]
GHAPAQWAQLFADGQQDFGRISALSTTKPVVQGKGRYVAPV